MGVLELQQQVNSQIESNDIQSANNTLLQLSMLVPEDINVLMQLAWTYFQLSLLHDAITVYNQVLDKNPNISAALFGIAMAHGQAGQMQKAQQYLLRFIRLEPNNIEALIKLASIDYLNGKIPSSMMYLMKAKKINPEHVFLNIRLGSLYTAMNEFDKAVKHYKIALKFEPDNSDATGQLASAYAYGGDTNKAIKIITPFLNRPPVGISVSIAFAQICRSLNRCNEAKKCLEDLLKNGIDQLNESTVLFALGNIYDREESYDKAFECFKRANDLNDFSYSSWEEELLVHEIKEKLNKDYFKYTMHAKKMAKHLKPVFIIGMPRSGTSLVEQILSSHPFIYGAGERMEIPDIARSISKESNSGLKYPFSLIHATQSVLSTNAKQYLRKISQYSPKNAKIIIDKMPDNYWHLPLIQLLFPKAKIIHCIRDPLDNCLSCYFTKLMGNAYSYNLKDLGIHYRLYEELIKHWKNVLTLPILDVHYEDMVNDSESMSRKIVDFCGLDWSDKCMEFYKNKRAVVTSSSDQVRQPIYKKSVARWRNYETHIGELAKALEYKI